METNIENKIKLDKSYDVVKNIMIISSFILKKGNKVFNKYNLIPHQFAVLNEIVIKQKINQKNLIEEMLMEKSHISKIVKKLKIMNLIEITRDEYDKRHTILTPTKKGIQIANKCTNDLSLIREKIVQDFKIKDIEKIAKVIKKAKSVIKTMII